MTVAARAAYAVSSAVRTLDAIKASVNGLSSVRVPGATRPCAANSLGWKRRHEEDSDTGEFRLRHLR